MQTKHQEVKQWLSRARNMRKRLDALQESKRKAYDTACSSTAPIRPDAAAQVSSVQTDGKMARYVYFSEEVNKQIARLEQVRSEILNAIAQVEDNTLATLLIEYYVNNKTWYEVANTLKYSYYEIVHRKHPTALKEIFTLLKIETKCNKVQQNDKT